MDESWRKRHPPFQPHHSITSSKDHLGPDDFRDVFGGPPCSVLRRYFSASEPYSHKGFRTIKRGPDPSNNLKLYNSDHNGFPVMQSEDNNSCHYMGLFNSDHVCSSQHEHKGFRVMNENDSFSCCNSDRVSNKLYGHNGFQASRRQDETSSNTDSGKSSHHNGFRLIASDDKDQSASNGFQIMMKEDFRCPPLKFNTTISATTDYTHNRFSNEALEYPISNRKPFGNRFHAFKREEGFYDDIYGSEANAGSRIRSRSRSISMYEPESTASSGCDQSVSRTNIGCEDDHNLDSFTMKLRPITIPSRRYDSSPSSALTEELANSTLQFSYPSTHSNNNADSNNANNSETTYKIRCNGSSFCCFTPPETDSLASFRLNVQKRPSYETNSPSSVVSSFFPCKDKEVEKNVVLETERGINENMVNEKGFLVLKMDGYVKLEKEKSVGSEASAALDEAIAWAKEKFMNQGEQNRNESVNENYVGFRDWNENNGKECREGKDR